MCDLTLLFSLSHLLFDKVHSLVLECGWKVAVRLELTGRGERDEENPAITLLQKLVNENGVLILAQHFGPFVCLHL